MGIKSIALVFLTAFSILLIYHIESDEFVFVRSSESGLKHVVYKNNVYYLHEIPPTAGTVEGANLQPTTAVAPH